MVGIILIYAFFENFGRFSRSLQSLKQKLPREAVFVFAVGIGMDRIRGTCLECGELLQFDFANYMTKTLLIVKLVYN